jgi:hypothetical protein
VKYGPAGGKAWTKGDVCRDVKDLCTDVDGSVKVAADLSVAGLVGVGLGQACLIAYSMKPETGNPVVMTSLALFAFAWIMLLASWTAFAGTIGKDAKCIVEADSNKGAVIASGKFGDIINDAGSYTFGFVIGAWLLLSVTITLVLLRIKDINTAKAPPVKEEEPEVNPVILEPVQKPVEPVVEPVEPVVMEI